MALGAAVPSGADAHKAPRVKVPRINRVEDDIARVSVPLVCKSRSCDYRVIVASGTARAGEDFRAQRAITRSLLLREATVAQFRIPIIDDTACEKAETIKIVVKTKVPGNRWSDTGLVRILTDGDCDIVPGTPKPAPAPQPAPAPAPAPAPQPEPPLPADSGKVELTTTTGSTFKTSMRGTHFTFKHVGS